MPVREPLMIEAQLMQYGRMQIVDTDRILGHLIAPRVAFTIDCAAADAAASQPGRISRRVVTATERPRKRCKGTTAEFGRPDDERLVEHATSFEILEQGGDRSVDVAGQFGIPRHFSVRIPVAIGTRVGIDQLDKIARCENLLTSSRTIPQSSCRRDCSGLRLQCVQKLLRA